MIRALAVTISTRAAAGVYPDRSGPVLADLLREAHCEVEGPVVVPDGAEVEVALRAAVAAGYDVVVTTGGTGLNPNDLTPEMTRLVVDREVPGIAGQASATLIVNLPGSTGGVRDGMAVLTLMLEHAVEQARGGDHPRTNSSQ